MDETNASGDGFMVKWAKERKVRLSNLRAVLQLSSMMVVVSCSGAVLLPVALVHAWKSELPLNSSTSAQINSWVPTGNLCQTYIKTAFATDKAG